MKNPSRLFLLLMVGMAVLSRLGATTLIYPVEGIADLWKLNAEDFHQKYGGINITGLGVGDEGWYVRYRHENLTYFFGPIADRTDAQKQMWELESVRDAAIRNDPKLSTSQVDFVRFNYSGVYGARGDTPFLGKGKSDDGKSGPDGDIDGDGIPNKDDPDMDGDGIPNEQDGDVDGDGIPNGQDKYPYGSSDRVGGMNAAGADRKGGKDGSGDGKDGQLAGAGGQSGKNGNQKGQTGDKAGAGENGADMGDPNSPVGAGQNGLQQVASAQTGGTPGQQGNRSGQQGNQSGQQGSQAGQQAGQQGSQSGQQGQSSSQSQGGQAGPPGQQGGSGNPLDLVALLFKKILGL